MSQRSDRRKRKGEKLAPPGRKYKHISEDTRSSTWLVKKCKLKLLHPSDYQKLSTPTITSAKKRAERVPVAKMGVDWIQATLESNLTARKTEKHISYDEQFSHTCVWRHARAFRAALGLRAKTWNHLDARPCRMDKWSPLMPHLELHVIQTHNAEF